MSDFSDSLSIVVVGASGDLARKKIYPALFALYCQGLLPEQFNVVGFARSKSSDEEFRKRVTETLTCRYVPGESCAQLMAKFLSKCRYIAGAYDSSDSFLDLHAVLREIESGKHANRMFYLAIPSSVFVDVARSIGNAGFVQCGRDLKPWSRAVIEKPFGTDRESSDLLTRELGTVFSEEQTYRIDHYLGKEVIQNLLVLRFANSMFEPIWNREFVDRVDISWSENIGVEGRGGYFDEYGIIRDVMQNHLLQILALVAMEPPKRFDAHCIIEEKVRLLRSVPPLAIEDLRLGQYAGYADDESVPAKDSKTPTFAAARIRLTNQRWDGVPFVVTAGKGLDAQKTEIRIKLRAVPNNMFCELGACPDANELVVRVQPDEAIHLKIANKVPGMDLKIEARDLDLRYKAAFDELIPDAYESLLLDVIRGEKGLFIRNDELAAAWDVFTPVLHEIECKGVAPMPYELGSSGPAVDF